MRSLALRRFGTDEAVEPARVLHAGPLTLELQRGRLRRICCGGREIWHGLAFVLRDADWGTPEALIDSVEIDAAEDSFEARIEGRFPGQTPLPFELHVLGSADGCIRFEAEARPGADLRVNRLGLCLMHALSACGARVEVRHVDGRTSTSTFPTLIPPWPPFTLVRALRHEWTPGHWAQAELEGDLFETEDQRNNADASFKTYSRSNMAPRPYRLSAGATIRQSARLRVEDAGSDEPARPAPLRVAVGEAVGALAPIGVEIHAADAQEPALLDVLRELQPAHLHLAWRPGLAVDWRGVAAMLVAADAGLRLDALLSEPRDTRTQLAGLKRELDAAGLMAEAIAVFASHAANIDAARRIFPGTPIGGGTPHFFVQLSRLDELGAVDFASFTTSSVVHGADDEEVMLGLASLPAMVETWRARHPTLPLRVGPNAIAARASPLGAQPPSDGTRRLALAAIDPRSRAEFGAAWALGHAAAFIDAGVQAITLMSLRGDSGIIAFDGSVVTRHPVFELMSRLGRRAERLAVDVSDRRRIAALALRRDGRQFTLLANLGGEGLAVEFAGAPGHAVSLEPYATVMVESPSCRALDVPEPVIAAGVRQP